MRSRLLAVRLAGLAVCLVLSACVATHKHSAGDDRAALEQIRARIQQAELAGDASVFEQIAAADVVVMPPKAEPISGRAASANLMRQFFRQFELRIEYASAEIQVHGDVAFDRGSYSQTVIPKSGGEAFAGKGSYLWVYGRAPDGSWLQTRVIWNSD